MTSDIYSKDLKTREDIAEYNKAELSRVFADTLNKDSKAGIIVQSLGLSSFSKSVVIGVPYRLDVVQIEIFPCSDEGNIRYDSVDILVLGAYALGNAFVAPLDIESKTLKIPLKDIIDFKRIELSDLLPV